MIIIDLEDIIGNAMFDLYCEKGIKTMSSDLLHDYQEKFFSILKERNIKYRLEDNRHTLDKINDYSCFSIIKNRDRGYQITMKDYVSEDDLIKYRSYLSFDILEVVGDKRLKQTLGLIEKEKIKETELDYLIEKVIEQPEKFYKDIANNLTRDEYQFIKENLEYKDCNTCQNGSCRIENDEKPVNDCLGWENQFIIGKAKILGKKNIYKLK